MFDASVKNKASKLLQKEETPIYFSTLIPQSAKVAILLIMFTEVLQEYWQPDNGGT